MPELALDTEKGGTRGGRLNRISRDDIRKSSNTATKWLIFIFFKNLGGYLKLCRFSAQESILFFAKDDPKLDTIETQGKNQAWKKMNKSW